MNNICVLSEREAGDGGRVAGGLRVCAYANYTKPGKRSVENYR